MSDHPYDSLNRPEQAAVRVEWARRMDALRVEVDDDGNVVTVEA